jgi:GGDEF domain-containing protein
MDTVAAGFWGAFFGTAALMLAGAVAAWARSLQRVAFNAALSSVTSVLFAVVYLGLVPSPHPDFVPRLVAHVSIVFGVMLAIMLMAMLGLMRERGAGRRWRNRLAALAAGVIAVGWLRPADDAMILSSSVGFSIGIVLLVICVRRARNGYRLAWLAVAGAATLLTALAGLTWIAIMRGQVHPAVHAVSAVAGVAYLATLASALWIRFTYLIELREIVTHGPTYDPITRMRKHAETGQMVGLAFFNDAQEDARPVGVIAISIGNLLSLSELHGQTAVNHGLFVCASRLQRCVPGDVEMGRLGDEGFLLLVRSGCSVERLAEIGQRVAERLARPVVLSTSAHPAELEAGQAHWVAQVGVGIVATTARERPSSAVIGARTLSRAAWSYPSRVAWHDSATGQVAEALLPAAA